jgi:hypothetical protein
LLAKTAESFMVHISAKFLNNTKRTPLPNYLVDIHNWLYCNKNMPNSQIFPFADFPPPCPKAQNVLAQFLHQLRLEVIRRMKMITGTKRSRGGLR